MSSAPLADQRTPAEPLVSRRDLLRWGSSGALLALGGGCFGAVESSAIVVEKRELTVPKWDADGFKAAVISDVHVNDYVGAARTVKAVRLALEEKPDVILLPGDFLNFSWSYTIDGMVQSLKELSEAKCPVLGIPGNHDYWTDDPHSVLEALRTRVPMRLLRNEVVDVDGVSIVGLDDALVGRYKPDIVSNCSNKSLLVMLHEPDYVVDTPSNASLQISGHSHGGQMCLPFGVVVRTPRGSWRYTKGFYHEANVPLYVTRGVGTVGLGMRTFCPPEVSLLTLRKAA